MRRAAVAVLALGLAGCSGGDDSATTAATTAPTTTAAAGASWAIAFVRDGSLALRTSDGAAAAPITRGSVFRRVVDRSPSFSPDGRSIAFVSDRGDRPQDDLYLLRVGGDAPRRLTNDARIELDPVWRDARRLVFVSCAIDFGECELAQVTSTGARRTTLRRRLPGPLEIDVRRAGPGTLVYAGGDAAGIELDLFSRPLAGGDARRLTNRPGRDNEPAVAPDGRIAFARDAAGAGSPRDIYVIGGDGGSARRLTTDGADDAAPAWSPDGARIAWVRQGDGDSELWVMNADGTCARALTANAGADAQLTWDPRHAPGPLDC